MKPPVASSKSGRGSTSRQQPQARRPVRRRAKGEHWSLRLYVAGQTPRSLAAFANLKQLCETHLQGRYDLEVIDLMRSPELARQDEIVALPTVVRRLPEPIKRVIGNLSSMERVMVGIDLAPPKSRR